MIDPCEPHWTAYISAIFVPVVALFAAWIAFRQSEIARNKLKLDLFDKRMVVYEAVRATLRAACRGKLTQEEELDYFMCIRSAQWLFGPKVFTYLDEVLWGRIVDIELATTMAEVTFGDERTEHIRTQADIKKWLMAQHKEFDALCADALSLKH